MTEETRREAEIAESVGAGDGAHPLVSMPRTTAGLRLEQITRRHDDDLQRLHEDESIARWYAGVWSHEQARDFAMACRQSWARDGIGKWIAYDRGDDELVGRGGPSKLSDDGPLFEPISRLVDPAWGQHRLEVGWAVRSSRQGCGHAQEIGQEAFAVARQMYPSPWIVSFTEVHNSASRAVAKALGMSLVGRVTGPGLIEGSTRVHIEALFAVYATRVRSDESFTLTEDRGE